MVTISPRIVALAAAALSAMLIASAPATHNFVTPSLTWNIPEPPPQGQFILAVDLLDSASITHEADTVEFDMLDLQEIVTHTLSPQNAPGTTPSKKELAVTLSHYQASCGWRTTRRMPPPSTDPYAMNAANFIATQMVQDRFLRPTRTPYRWLDTVCMGAPLNAARGAASVDEAVAAWTGKFGERDPNVLLIQRGEPKPVPAAWVADNGNRRYGEIPLNDSSGRAMFLDRASIQRSGEGADAQILVFLGPAAHRRTFSNDMVVALRKSHYDCQAGSSLVTAEAGWNAFGELVTQSDVSFGLRHAAQSPVTAAELKAVCSSDAAAAPAFSSLDDVWTFTAARWQQPNQAVWASCLWQKHTAEERDAFMTAWRAHVPPSEFPSSQPAFRLPGQSPEVAAEMSRNMHDKLPRLIKPTVAALNACAVPISSQALAWSAADAYALQQGVLEQLAKAKIGEAQILAAWRAIPWLERQKFIRANTEINVAGLKLQADVIARIAQRLGLSDTAAQEQLRYYLRSQARLENS